MKILSKCAALLIAIAAAVSATPASAQATRTWVSGVGDDVNPCSRTAPCKTFAGAISKTAAGGEINCLDPGGFGAITITKSITIDCTGTFGSILASSTNGVIINGANVVVTLRGLSINGGTPAAPGLNGIRFIQGTSLTVEDSIIQNFTGAAPNGFGILFAPGTLAELHVSNTLFNNNGTAASGGGIFLQATGANGAGRVRLDNVRMDHNPGFGVRVDTTANTSAGGMAVSIDNSQISGSAIGIFVNAPAGFAPARLMLNNTTLAYNSAGLNGTGPGSRSFVANSTIYRNTNGLVIATSGQISSFGNNQLIENTTNGAFTLPLIPPS
jgi:hypothetical protein